MAEQVIWEDQEEGEAKEKEEEGEKEYEDMEIRRGRRGTERR